MLEIITNVNEGTGTFCLIGDLDIASVELLKCKVESVNVDSVVIDMDKLEFLDSTGVGTLIQIIRQHLDKNIDIKVKNISEEVFEVLDLLAIPELLGEELFIKK